MFNSLSLFSDTRPTHINVITGNGKLTTQLISTKIGTVSFTLSDGQIIIMKEALFVPNLS
jgi:hypothetical protein